MKYVINSLHRRDVAPSYFCAIHGFTPMFSVIEKARRFDSEEEARQYALKELFTHEAGVFTIEPTL